MHQITAIGEILWDVFPDGPRFGGAPANFACSTAELGRHSAHVRIVSAVGNDDLGRDAIDALTEHTVDVSAVQINDRATGCVHVTLDTAGAATYQFAENTAWDHLSLSSDLQRLASGSDAVCFGTLGQRSKVARFTIQQFVQSTSKTALRILDVNLRPPYFQDEVILQSLELANVLKLNDEELPVLGKLIGATGTDVDIIEQLAARFDLRYVALTLGSEGAIIWSPLSVSRIKGNDVDVVDTVGAGDAYTASMTLGLLQNLSIDRVNENAIAAASYVCSRPGGTTRFPERF